MCSLVILTRCLRTTTDEKRITNSTTKGNHRLTDLYDREVQITEYSKTPSYRAPIYQVSQFTGPQFSPPTTSFMCKSV